MGSIRLTYTWVVSLSDEDYQPTYCTGLTQDGISTLHWFSLWDKHEERLSGYISTRFWTLPLLLHNVSQMKMKQPENCKHSKLTRGPSTPCFLNWSRLHREGAKRPSVCWSGTGATRDDWPPWAKTSPGPEVLQHADEPASLAVTGGTSSRRPCDPPCTPGL